MSDLQLFTHSETPSLQPDSDLVQVLGGHVLHDPFSSPKGQMLISPNQPFLPLTEC